jgi:hypothetical protein
MKPGRFSNHPASGAQYRLPNDIADDTPRKQFLLGDETTVCDGQ